MKTKAIISVLFLAVIFISGCKKEGPPGPAGTNGTDGNANVTSLVLNTGGGWSWDGANYWRVATWTGLSNLSTEVVNSGAVMLYYKSGSDYLAMPFALNITSTIQLHGNFDYTYNVLRVYWELSDLADPNPGYTEFKLICIPPASLIGHNDLNLKNYNEVAKTFNLK